MYECVCVCVFQIVVSTTCENNICENGGSCSQNVNDVTCDCASGFTGFVCEEQGIYDVTFFFYSLIRLVYVYTWKYYLQVCAFL